MAERKPGSDRGRTTVDWEAAFAFYASLPDPERSYQTVADHFEVSVRTVEKHGRDQHWKKRLQEVKREAAAVLNEQLVGRQIDSLQDVLKLADATFKRYAQQLQAGTVKVTPSDLARMVALQAQVADTITALTTASAQEAEDAGAEKIDRAAEDLEVLRALRDAGALDRILNAIDTTPPDEEEQ